MGIVQRQSIKQSLINYIGVGIAAISMIFIYPQDPDVYGLARFVIDTSYLFAPFILLGFGGVTIRFFPQFKDEKKGHSGFLFFLTSGVFIGSLLFILFSLLFKEQFYNLFADKEPIYQAYLPYLVPLAILIAFQQLFYNYSSNFKRIAIPTLFQNLIKLSLPILILLFIWGMITEQIIVYGIILTFALAVTGIVLYIKWLGQLNMKPDFSLLVKDRVNEIKSFATFSFFSSMGSMLAFRIDTFMITALIDLQNTGIFAISAFIANTIAIPTNAVNQIASPVVAEAMKNKDMTPIKELYKNSSLNLLVIGLLLFICIAASIEDLFSIMPKGENLIGGVAIVLLVGASKLVDMGTSINNQIINYSKHYRFGFYAILLMAVFNIITNILLIPKYGIIGVALATLLSLSLYNIVKLIFIQWKFKMQPFSKNTVWILVVALVAYLIGVMIPASNIAVLDILIKSIVIGSVYISITYYFNLSSEFNEILKKSIGRFIKHD